MPSLLNSEHVSAAALGSTTDAILNELSRQLASVNGRRLSRGSNGHRTPGSSMRVTKPNSANNSPQSSLLQSRRRTLMNDGLHGRVHLPHPIEASYLPTPSTEMAYDPINNLVKKAPRPMSWHPSPQRMSQSQPQQQQQQALAQQYPFPPYQEAELYANFQQLPPTPAAYSGYNSPASATAFSPLSLPYSNLEYPTYVSPNVNTWAGPAASSQPQSSSSSLSSGDALSALPQQLPRLSGSSGSSADWDVFADRNFDRCTAPPTPENFQPPPQSQAKLLAEDTIPFQPLDDESDGEILYGMGLYDAPENSQMDYHRSTVLSLLGPADSVTEPVGKGLKLEDAWEPPALDDDDEDEENEDDEDADGEDQDDD